MNHAERSGKFLVNAECISCGSDSGLAIYENADKSTTGYCFSCKKYFSSEELNGTSRIIPLKRTHMDSNKHLLGDIEDISVIAEIPDRGINLDSAKRFGIRVSYSESSREIDKHYYPYYKDNVLVGYKIRNAKDKSFYSIGNIRDVDFFGQTQCGSEGKMLLITEGELDAASAYQMFKARGKNYRVCSLPNGANPAAIAKNIEWIESFDTVIFCTDQDMVGQEATKKMAEMLRPGKAKIMHFSEKDPNAMLLTGKVLEFFGALFNAKEIRPDGIVSVDDVFESAIKPVEYGLSWPWPTLTKVTYGYRRKEIYGIGGASGGGKTEYAKELIDHIINIHKLPVGVIFLEEEADKTVKVLAGKKYNKRFHIPDGDWTIDELITGINDLKGKVYLYNHFGSKGWDSIKSKIRYMVIALGIKDIVLDHLTALVAQEDNEYKALNRIMEEMASMVQELNFTLFYISHLRKPQGTPHEEGGRVTADQFKGSGAIVYWSNFLFGIERNQQAEDMDERNTTVFRVLKDRNTGLATGTTFKLWYDHPTGRWREKTDNDGLGEL